MHVHQEARTKSTRLASKWYVCNNRKPPRYCKPYGMRMLQEDVLDNWVVKELAPLLVAEMESIRSTAGRDVDTQALADTDRKIAELRKKETASLRDMVGVFANEQIAMLAGDFRAQREQLEREANELRPRLSQHDDLPNLSVDVLAEMPKSAIKDALRRVVQWIAIGKDGVIVLTSFGTYIGATFREIEKGTYFTAETRTTIYPPTPNAALRCLHWLPSPKDFIIGRRASKGKKDDVLSDTEILPGIDALSDAQATVAEVEVIIEEIQLDN